MLPVWTEIPYFGSDRYGGYLTLPHCIICQVVFKYASLMNNNNNNNNNDNNNNDNNNNDNNNKKITVIDNQTPWLQAGTGADNDQE